MSSALKGVLLTIALAVWVSGFWLYRVATSPAYQVAKDFITADLQVMDELGLDIRFPVFPGASWTALYQTNDARYRIPVFGEHQRTIVVAMRLHKDEWDWHVAEASFDDREGKPVDIMKLPSLRRIKEFCADKTKVHPLYEKRVARVRADVCKHLDQ